ncbi:Nitrate reductase [Sphingomonas jeddahensis]|uniref:Nitrate reductase n=1 Tax=Sphingomonas jeddahensis TaxID=1915074 RepID=A0A1V2ETV3_9SPHN|nr:Nitrate reductase [Sphingomonas jeddahensis]
MRQSRDSAREIWGKRTPHPADQRWPARVDERVKEEPDRWVQSACVLCSNGCGCDIGVKDGRIVGVRGRAVDVVNFGRMGPKGLNGWEANNSPDRLTTPLIRRAGRLEPTSWDEAMSLIAQRTRDIRDRYTSSAIGFYTSGQLFLEEYYTLAMIGKAGLGTPHMDGNTRLCTATAAAALKETFGSDGQPGAYEDIDVTDCIVLVGHNMAATDTVLWMRILDRLAAPDPPKLIVIDPRHTATAEKADVHLAPKVGTNLALLNGLLHLLIDGGHADHSFIDAHTRGFDVLTEIVREYTPGRVEEITHVHPADLRRAADIIAASKGLVSTCLQGVYQSNQATATACQVNNLNLILGRIGRPGCGILQMNGQPTSQNTRETGADGDLPGFRNWANMEHIRELARLWNVEPDIIPHWSPPTHALEMFHHCETGSIRMLWISATNPAVSMPNLPRIRAILEKEELFVVAQDAFMTETTQLADVVLPAAIWGEKTGCFTNVSRTVHISHKAVDPPGAARSDLDIWLDYARRMEFRDKDGAPLIKWSDAEGAFDAWRECSRGRPCDYSGLSYAKLTGGSGIPWPVNEAHPNGSVRIYEDLRFPTDPEFCEHFGSDLDTGAPWDETKFRAFEPDGRAFLKGTHYRPPTEEPDAEYPIYLTTGRLVYHFHTRTKTGRSKPLRDAAPEERVQIARADAQRIGIGEGDWVRITSRRGSVEARATLGDIAPGHAFVPFHFGYWDGPGHAQAANELTLFEWDPISKQPHFKYAAVRLERVDEPSSKQPIQVNLDPEQTGGDPSLASAALRAVKGAAKAAVQAVTPGKPRAHLADYLGLLDESEKRLIKAFDQVRETHPDTPDVVTECKMFAEWASQATVSLQPFIARYGERLEDEPERLDKALLVQRKQAGFDLLRDMHDLFLLVNESLISVTVLDQAALALRDEDLRSVLENIRSHNDRMREWLYARCRQAAPQVLVVPS